MNRFPMVLIDWQDSYSSDGWRYAEDHVEDTAADIRSIGWLVEETNDYYRIALSHDGQKEPKFNGFLSIPKGMVRAFKTLRIGHTRKSDFDRNVLPGDIG